MNITNSKPTYSLIFLCIIWALWIGILVCRMKQFPGVLVEWTEQSFSLQNNKGFCPHPLFPWSPLPYLCTVQSLELDGHSPALWLGMSSRRAVWGPDVRGPSFPCCAPHAPHSCCVWSSKNKTSPSSWPVFTKLNVIHGEVNARHHRPTVPPS